MNYKYLIFERNVPVVKITLNRPECQNALSLELSDEMAEAVRQVNGDDDIRIVIFTGAGGNFCSGDDIKQFDQWGGETKIFDRIWFYQSISNMIENLPQVTIAAIEGNAVGGGLELTMVCDFAIGTEDSHYGIPEIDIGCTPGWGGTQRMGRMIGRRKVKDLILTGRLIDAWEAERLNLITKVVPKGKLDDAVADLVKILLSKDQIVLKAAKHIINRGLEADLFTGLGFELFSHVMTRQTEEGKNSYRSFNKKKGVWPERRVMREQSEWVKPSLNRKLH
jgi:enoyl-CoA hydratase